MLPFALRQYCLSDSSLTPDEVCMAGADKARIDEHIDWKIGKMNYPNCLVIEAYPSNSSGRCGLSRLDDLFSVALPKNHIKPLAGQQNRPKYNQANPLIVSCSCSVL